MFVTARHQVRQPQPNVAAIIKCQPCLVHVAHSPEPNGTGWPPPNSHACYHRLLLATAGYCWQPEGSSSPPSAGNLAACELPQAFRAHHLTNPPPWQGGAH